ncbi:hypothetical protein RhiTH_009491 [Rhizoctonia solani]
MTFAKICQMYYLMAKKDRYSLGPHVHFALTGHCAPHNQALRSKLADLRELVADDEIQQTCDVDSGIGLVFRGDSFPIQAGFSLFVYVLNNTHFTLRSSLHIPPLNVPDAQGNPSAIYAEPHQIPHIYLGFMGGASVAQIPVRMVFPGLYARRQAQGANFVDQDLVAELYNKAIYPAAKVALPSKNLQNWPPSFKAEAFRAGKDSGGVTFAPQGVPEEYANAFFEGVHAAIDNTPELDWAVDFFLQIQVQGTKDATSHTVHVPQESTISRGLVAAEAGPEVGPDQETAFRRERTRQIVRALRPLELRKLKAENWWIDIATTISLDDPSHSLLIRKQTHGRFISLLTGLSITKAEDIIRRGPRGGYSFDEFFHTGLFGGFHLELPSSSGSPWKTPYIQVYTTDKTLTSHKDGKKFSKELEPNHVFRSMRNVEEKFLEPLINVTKEARSEERPIWVRAETRVPLPFAWDVHRKFDPAELAFLTSKQRTKPIWHYRKQIKSVPRTLLAPPATLILGLTWMANALMSRPKEGGEWDVLRDTLSVHKVADGVLVPDRPLEIFYLHSLVWDPCPRVSTHRYLSLKSIMSLLGLARGAADSKLVGLLLGNRKRKSVARAVEPASNERDNNEVEVGETSFVRVIVSRAARMVTHIDSNAPTVFTAAEASEMPQAVVEHQYASEAEDPEQQHDSLSNFRSMESIFQRMAAEILRKVPSTAQGRSWRLISEAEAKKAQWSALCDSTQLPQLMVGWVQTADKIAWNTTIDRLFPTLEMWRAKTANGKNYMQNLSTCSWFRDYEEILKDTGLTEADKDAITERARKKLRETKWLPKGAGDRLWGSMSTKVIVHGRRIGDHPPAIILNPTPRGKPRPNVDIPGGRRADV